SFGFPSIWPHIEPEASRTMIARSDACAAETMKRPRRKGPMYRANPLMTSSPIACGAVTIYKRLPVNAGACQCGAGEGADGRRTMDAARETCSHGDRRGRVGR